MERIGVRELCQHASRYLARVRLGETVEVTERGRPIAHLVPVPEDRWLALMAAGSIRPPSDPTPLAQVRPQRLASDASLGQTLTEMRDEDDR